MEKDLYVGSLSRYYTQNWFEDLEPADSDLTPAEIQKITSGWRDSVMQATGGVGRASGRSVPSGKAGGTGSGRIAAVCRGKDV